MRNNGIFKSEYIPSGGWSMIRGGRLVRSGDLAAIGRIETWLLDMDGTVTLGEKALPGADEFFAALALRDPIPQHVFVTNNSSHGTDHYLRRLARAGLPATRLQVVTSTDALASWFRNAPSCAGRPPVLYPVGTKDFEAELVAAGCSLVHEKGQAVDFVAVGFDTTLTYAKLDAACDYIRSGTPYAAANPDRVCPLEGGRVLPDCGCILAFLRTCTDTEPIVVVGKPSTAMVDALVSDRGLDRRFVAMVGDRVYTDLAVARNAGILCVAVLSGEATLAEIEASGVDPDLIVDGIGDLAALL
jgi:HAD superfamily hydrolase (TIGR01450 family)